MSRLSSADQSAVLSALRELYAQTDLAALRATIARVAARLVPCDVGSYNEVDRANARPLVSLRFPDSNRFRQVFPAFQAHFRDHPITRYNQDSRRGEARTLSDFVTAAQLARLPIYNEYYRVVGVRYQIVFYFERDDAPIQRAISLNRSGRDFSQRDRDVLDLIRPHCLQAFENATAFRQGQLAIEAMEKAHAQSTQAPFIVGDDRHIRWLSDRARQWLREYCDMEADIGVLLPEPLWRWLARIQEQRSNAETALGGIPPPLRFAKAGGSLDVRLVNEDADRNLTLMLALSRGSGRPSPRGRPELTVRENEVLAWIAEGKSNPEIAAILGLSVRTVYKHVENIFPKLGVENRAGAMLRVLETAPQTCLPK